jgi:cytidylate kinase
LADRLDERYDPLFYRLVQVFMRGSMEQSVAVHGMGHFDADSMVEFIQRVISGAASESNLVIVGRGAPFLLRGRPDTFHVFVHASLEGRAPPPSGCRHHLMINSKVGDEIVISTVLNEISHVEGS